MNIGKLLKEAQKAQARMAEAQAKLDAVEIVGAAGGGMVQITMNGKGEVKRVKIDPSLAVPSDIEVLEDLIVAAGNDARAKVETRTREEMQKVTGDFKLPPGVKLPF
jgi:DNA-binding YbaB/EbfC family protein